MQPRARILLVGLAAYRFSPSVENEQGDAGRDGRARLAKPISQARMGNREMFVFPIQLTTSRIGDHDRLVHNLLKVLTIYYILVHTYTRRLLQRDKPCRSIEEGRCWPFEAFAPYFPSKKRFGRFTGPKAPQIR